MEIDDWVRFGKVNRWPNMRDQGCARIHDEDKKATNENDVMIAGFGIPLQPKSMEESDGNESTA